MTYCAAEGEIKVTTSDKHPLENKRTLWHTSGLGHSEACLIETGTQRNCMQSCQAMWLDTHVCCRG